MNHFADEHVGVGGELGQVGRVVGVARKHDALAADLELEGEGLALVERRMRHGDGADLHVLVLIDQAFLDGLGGDQRTRVGLAFIGDAQVDVHLEGLPGVIGHFLNALRAEHLHRGLQAAIPAVHQH
ncbi:hypothetical protein D3C71_1788310 [compost metagenome]